MIGGADNDGVAGQPIHLHEQRTDNALDLSGFLGITALFANRIEFIEEQHTRVERRVLDQLAQPIGRLTQEAVDHRVISNRQQRQRQFSREDFCQAGFPVAGGAYEQERVPRLKGIGTQQCGMGELKEELLDLGYHVGSQHQLGQAAVRRDVEHQVRDAFGQGFARLWGCSGDGRSCCRRDCAVKTRKQLLSGAARLGDDGLHRPLQSATITSDVGRSHVTSLRIDLSGR